jgi:hypothetical protein
MEAAAFHLHASFPKILKIFLLCFRINGLYAHFSWNFHFVSYNPFLYEAQVDVYRFALNGTFCKLFLLDEVCRTEQGLQFLIDDVATDIF